MVAVPGNPSADAVTARPLPRTGELPVNRDRDWVLDLPTSPASAAQTGTVATRVGPMWGFGDGHELRNMFVLTAQPGHWFISGSFAQCQIYSERVPGHCKQRCMRGMIPGKIPGVSTALTYRGT